VRYIIIIFIITSFIYFFYKDPDS